MIKDSKKHLKDAEENYLRNIWVLPLKYPIQLLIASLQAFISFNNTCFISQQVLQEKLRELYFYIEERKRKVIVTYIYLISRTSFINYIFFEIKSFHKSEGI